ncbi:hypothetical protein KC343_g4478 [Hortaea werneckii]|nr:hypothetical protein KC346_g5223 [Hortaea werneckii]KAI7630669.1 hypothetical protein KC343_g4478 [Hortaea werneckii]
MDSKPRREQKRKRTTSLSTENQKRDLTDDSTTQPTDRIGAAASKPPASSMDRTWIFYNSTEDHNRGQKQTVRSHAAIASWAARRQQWQNSTISSQNTDGRRTPADRQPAVTSTTSSANRQESPLSTTTWSTNSSQPSRELLPKPPSRPPPPAEEAWSLLEKMGADCAECLRGLGSEDAASSPACLVDLVKSLHEHRRWFSGGIDGSSLAQRATKTFLWDSFASTGLLSHIALLVAGTYTQCPPTALAEDAAWELSSIQRATRGATLRMLQAAVAAPQCDATTPLALATFSSWERRYGDGVGWKAGMAIWDKASLPSKALDADLSPLVEVVQEIMRQELEDRSYISPRQINFRPPDADVQTATKPVPGTRCVPSGFSVFRMDRPEHRSLVSLADDVYQNFEPSAEASAYRRKLGFAITSWSPRHTLASETCTPDLLHLMEREHSDQAELSALLHVRACLRVLNTLLNSLVLDHLGELSLNVYAVQRGLDLCTASYVARLDTEALADTRFAHVAFWAVYVLCSISFSEGQAELLRRLMTRHGLRSWAQIEHILASHMNRDVPSVWDKCKVLFEERLDPSSSSGHEHSDREELDARMAVRDLWK